MDTWLMAFRWSRVMAVVAGLLVAVSPGAVAQEEVQPVAAPAKTSVMMSLPPERADRLKVLMGRIKLENAQLDERLNQYREGLEELYRAYRFDEQRCRRMHQLIRQTQDQLLELHHRFQIQMRVLLTPTEYELLQREFQQAREEKLDRMREADKLKMLRALQKPAPDSKE
jgi:Spy/CpxP family protein refolding chaperone